MTTNELFTIDAEPLRLPNWNDRFVFLYSGGDFENGPVHDLLDAYTDAFAATDPVVLVLRIEEEGDGRGEQTGHRVKAFHSSSQSPRLMYIPEPMEAPDRAKLFARVARLGAFAHFHRNDEWDPDVVEAVACGCRIGLTAYGSLARLFTPLRSVDSAVVGVGFTEPRCAQMGNYVVPEVSEIRRWMLETVAAAWSERSMALAAELGGQLLERCDHRKVREAPGSYRGPLVRKGDGVTIHRGEFI